MDEGLRKLLSDLEIIDLMAAEIPEYIRSDVLFWNMARSDAPSLTFGGYLMRQHRLLGLRHMLEEEEQQRLRGIIDRFEEAIDQWVVRVENKMHTEIQARLRQWMEFIRDMREDRNRARASYPTAVDARVMLHHLVEHLEHPTYQLNQRVYMELDVIDRRWRQFWTKGEFVWPEKWKPAYPDDEFWYLYY